MSHLSTVKTTRFYASIYSLYFQPIYSPHLPRSLL